MRFEKDFLKYSEQIIGIENPRYFSGNLNRYIYADWAASGRVYKEIEEKILKSYAPYYSNIHTKDNMIGTFMNSEYEKSKDIIKKHFGAINDFYLFLNGTGMTGAIDKLQRILSENIDINDTVIFVTNMEHNSNYLTWLELGAKVEIVEPDNNGNPDISSLEKLLIKNNDKKYKIGSFTACSNITGIKVEWENFVKAIHRYGGMAFIDFSISAPYIDINLERMNSIERPDGIFCSMHKFLGGPGAPGLLFLKKELYRRNTPTIAGGGTVLWTNPWGERKYYEEPELIEDAGTPGLLQVIRAGLVIELKNSMNIEKINLRENDIYNYIIRELSNIEDVELYGDKEKERLPIIIFNIKGIYYEKVVKVLSDIYGIQARGGCMCAGVYSHYLLNIDKQESEYISHNLKNKNLKPGFIRISLSQFSRNDEVVYIIESIKDIVKNKY